MRVLSVLLGIVVGAFLLARHVAAPPLAMPASQLEQDVLAALNRVRANPAGLVPVLEELRTHFVGLRLDLPGRIPLQTVEGSAAVTEAIDVLKSTPPLPTFRRSDGLSLAARDHAADLGQSGRTGHKGADGSAPAERMNRHGRWQKASGEAIAFGDNPGEAVVAQLLIDDDVPNRGHRTLLLAPDYRVAGVSCAPHPTYGQVCVIDLAADFVEGP